MKLFGSRPNPPPVRAEAPRGPRFQLTADPFLLEALAGVSSARISRRDALSVPAVLKARNMIAGIPSTLPINVHDKTLAVDTRTTVVVDPEGSASSIPSSWTYAMTFEDLLFESVSYWRVTRMSAEGFPVEASHLDHRAVSQHSILGMPSEVLSEDLQFSPRDPIFVDGSPVPPREIIRFVSPNPPLLKHAARAIRMALLLDKAAEVYTQEPIGLGYFTDREDADALDDDEITEVLDNWASMRRARAFGYVPGGLDLRQLQWDAQQIQLADARQHAVLEIARATGLDPEDLGVSTTSRTYQNSVDRKQALIDFGLMPYMNAVEERLSKDDVIPRGLHARFDTSGFLRGDTKSRMEANKIGREIGAITDDEIREAEHRPPLSPAEKRLNEDRARPPQPVAPAGPPNGRQPAMSNGNGVRVGFAGGDVLRLEVPEVDAQFRVDRTSRRVSGLVLPWGHVAYSGGFRWRFQRGSISWSDVSRVKLLRDHDLNRPVGKAIELEDRDDGLYGTFSVMRGPAGDEVLSMAEDGVLDGFSAGPSFESSDSWQRDPSAADVRLVRASRLIETTITAIPAFDSARVQSVVAQHQGAGMAEQGNGDGQGSAKLEADKSGMERFEAELDARMVKITDKLAEAQGAQQESIAKTVSDAFAAAFQRLGDVDTTGRGELAHARIKVISEPPVYRFNGDRSGPSLVRDAWLAKMEGDHEAQDRQRKFMEQQRDMVHLLQVAGVSFAAETTVTTPQIVPPGYRPDLFVTELNRGRPIVAQASRGTITDATPFVVPRFVSSTGATADHVEGTNPADADMTLDTTTVTPGAISGSFKVSREIMDSSNPAIDAIALATMRESYNRQTETKAYLALKDKAVAPLVQDVTQAQLAAADSVLIGFVRGLLALYPFTRFAAPTGAVMNQPATSNFSNAKDTTNRPLLPSVGATNTAGVGNAVQQGWFIDGLPFVPAWAIPTALGDDAVIIINRADFWVWESPLLTFRFEEKQGPAIIELALFSYYASHVLRPSGIAAINEVA